MWNFYKFRIPYDDIGSSHNHVLHSYRHPLHFLTVSWIAGTWQSNWPIRWGNLDSSPFPRFVHCQSKKILKYTHVYIQVSYNTRTTLYIIQNVPMYTHIHNYMHMCMYRYPSIQTSTHTQTILCHTGIHTYKRISNCMHMFMPALI
jgi:hypothetical protein